MAEGHVKGEWMQMTADMMSWQPTIALLIFLIAYAIWMTEQWNRALVALVAAMLFLLLGIVQWSGAIRLDINWDTLLLWAGLMVMAAVLGRTGWIEHIAVLFIRHSGRRPALVYLYLMLVAGVGAALLDPVTMMLLLVPIILAVAGAFRLSAIPLLIGAVLATNIGGTATLIGQPVNMWLGTANRQLDFTAFITALGPLVLVLFVLNTGLVWLCYCKTLRFQPSVLQPDALAMLKSDKVGTKRSLALRVVVPVLFVLIIVALALAPHLGWTPGTVAAGGAVLLLLAGKFSGGIRPLAVLKQLEWDTLLFFVGLFIIVGGLAHTGWIAAGATYLIELTDGNIQLVAMIVLWVTGLLSAAMEHMPLVATMIPLLQETGQQMEASSPALLNPLWWSLALGAGIGSSGTLLGSAAGLIAASMAERSGEKLRYVEFLRITLPLTLLSLLLSSLYVLYVLMP
ncbi:SLC13 family permease [Paenibacillus campi]|uniref:SLC13 family permease n=1 Tax=Paenibacillus campi TaxID=3106031 RepID=UPI002AFE61BF|nr:SLC13 family permease [Paenibacillus sp. SGZ-1014]